MHLIKLSFQYPLLFFFRWMASLRYRIAVKGLSEIVKEKGKGILFLPNHPAEIDPVILTAVLWRKFRLRPLIYDHFYYKKWLRFFIDLFVDPLPISSMEVNNEWKKRQFEKLKTKILSELGKGKNFLIYPSGKLKSTPEEKIGGASLVHQLLEKDPHLKIVLVRTTGLWGSTFSRAITGFTPDFGKAAKHGIISVLKNLIFFTPRRKVLIEFATPGEDFPRREEKKVINEWLENWYNQKGSEPLQLVSFSRWKKDLPTISAQKEKEKEIRISEELKVQVLTYLSKLTKQPLTELHTDLHLSNDLGLDSLDISQIHVFLEEEFEVTTLAPGTLQTVRDILHAAMGKEKEGEKPESEKRKRWPKEISRHEPHIPKGKTIPEVFLRSCERMGNAIACSDALAGVLTYQKLKRAALVLSLEIRKMPGEKIGILLPSSVAAYITILATLLSGKIPVMLNWTTGSRNIEHAAEVCSLKVVLSSFRFLSRLDHCDLGRVDDLLLLLEKVRKKISFKDKLRGFLLSFRSTQALLKKIPHKLSEEDPAVVLFTSGTETLPKGVPLSHRNLLTNQRAALSCVKVKAQDSFYAVLPPFHSFGFSVTGLLPLLSGIKVCYAPDPTESRGLVNDIEHWGATIFCAAPSFIQPMLRLATEKQLKTLRVVVSGAEKAPRELYDTLQAKGKVFLEGYGISECSPIVTLQREEEPQVGVGRPLPGIDLCILDPETEKLLPRGEKGEVCIFGESVFQGYLGVKKDPFIEKNGKRWYRSGDQGFLDQEGNLTITGRLTRFLKVGGEMISLGGLEEDLVQIAMDKGWAKKNSPFLAVAASSLENEKPQIVIFSTVDMNKDKINETLKEKGHGRLIKVAEIRKIKEIPLTGTGKIHYRLLDEML